MMTVLFVLVVLFFFGEVLSLIDGQRASSGEIGTYLRYEYNMADAERRPTLAQLRNI